MTSTRRLLPVALATLIAALTASVAIAHSTGSATAEHAGHDHMVASPAHSHAAISAKELALRTTMDRLWQEHVVWTRLAIISLTTNAPDHYPLQPPRASVVLAPGRLERGKRSTQRATNTA